MSHFTPQVELVWLLLSGLLFVYLVIHLYFFDRFQCLRFWKSRNGAFMRVMSVAYLLSVPLLFTRNIIMTTIKYHEGYVSLPQYGIISKPPQLWTHHWQSLLFPANLIFGVAWAMEISVHLEELFFWLFLTRKQPSHWSWFRSWHFRFWASGSIAAILSMVLTTVMTRNNDKTEAYIVLCGTLLSTLVTIAFIYVLYIFPDFIHQARTIGAGPDVLSRLQRFNELNVVRIFFRFLFVAPLMTLAIDGMQTHAHINENMFQTDILAMIGGMGCVISSSITLQIFFPRKNVNMGDVSLGTINRAAVYVSGPRFPATPSKFGRSANRMHENGILVQTTTVSNRDRSESVTSLPPAHLKFDSDWETARDSRPVSLHEHDTSASRHVDLSDPSSSSEVGDPQMSIHPMVFKFTSPMDVMQYNGHKPW